ncbi:MAG: hypothetical protein KDJ74_18315 [Notoacmeibacter sp.]|nr:hypothetical protein [Notoacmeibacter sp.]
MVGGKIVSIGYMGDGIFKLTCVGTGCEARDKISVNVKNPVRLPEIGSECWWQSGKVYCEGDTLILDKIGNSHNHGPRIRAAKEAGK